MRVNFRAATIQQLMGIVARTKCRVRPLLPLRVRLGRVMVLWPLWPLWPLLASVTAVDCRYQVVTSLFSSGGISAFPARLTLFSPFLRIYSSCTIGSRLLRIRKP